MLDQLSICVFSYLFFCRITFFFSPLITSFLLFMCVIYDVWCFMKRFSWFFFFFFLHSFSLISSFTFTSKPTFELWQSRSGASQSRLPVFAAAATTARSLKRSVVWFECERSHSSLFQTLLTVGYLSCPDHQFFCFFFLFLVKAMFS